MNTWFGIRKQMTAEGSTSPSQQRSDSSPLLRGTAVVGGLTLLSRLLGFARDILLAGLLGAGLRADAFFVAYRIPNLLRSLLAEGALTSAFVPTFTDELHHGRDQAQRLLHSAVTLLFLVSVLLSVAGIILSEQLVVLFAPGFLERPEQFHLTASLLRIMFGYIVSVSFVALVNAALNAFHIFGFNALAQVVVNLFLILGTALAYLMAEEYQVFVIAWSVMAGAVVQMAIQWIGLGKAKLEIQPTRAIFTPAIRKMLLLMIPAVFGTAVYQVVQFFNTVLASLFIPGSVTWLFYADRLSQLPLGIFTVALGSVLLPQLALHVSSGNAKEYSTELENSLRFVSFVLLPVSFALFFAADDFVRLVFERGAFSSRDVEMTALALQAQAIGIWAVSAHALFVRGFLALKKPVVPALIALLTLFIHLILSLVLVGEISATGGIFSDLLRGLQLALPFGKVASLGHVGLALSMSISAFISLAAAWWLMFREFPMFRPRRFVRSTALVLVIACASGAGARAAVTDFDSVFIRFGLFCALFSLLYISLSFFCRLTELQETLSLIARIAKRKGSRRNGNHSSSA